MMHSWPFLEADRAVMSEHAAGTLEACIAACFICCWQVPEDGSAHLVDVLGGQVGAGQVQRHERLLRIGQHAQVGCVPPYTHCLIRRRELPLATGQQGMLHAPATTRCRRPTVSNGHAAMMWKALLQLNSCCNLAQASARHSNWQPLRALTMHAGNVHHSLKGRGQVA